jgi:hypothetical protein
MSGFFRQPVELMESETRHVSEGVSTFSAPPRKQKTVAQSAPIVEIVAEPVSVALVKDNLAMQGSDVDWTLITDAQLGDRINESFSALELVTRSAQAEMRGRMLPAIQEVRRRFKAGHKVSGFVSITAFYRGIGLNPDTLYSWESRARKDASNEAVRIFEAGKANELTPEKREQCWWEWEKKKRKDNKHEQVKAERERLNNDPIARLKANIEAIDLGSSVRAVIRVTHQTEASIAESAKQRKELGKLLKEKSKELESLRNDLLNEWSREEEAIHQAELEEEDHAIFGEPDERQQAATPETETIGV